MQIIFLIICIISTTIGAISGIGGGVIIKPVFDMTADMSATTISFLSGCTVLSMSVYSLFSSRNSEVKVETKRGTKLAVGAAVGGILGKYLFDMVKTNFPNATDVSIVQNYILAFLTLAVFFYMLYKSKIKGYDIQNTALCLLIGGFLGATGAFLGIGGGPINLIVLYYFFSMDTKLAALTSIYIIFFSQIASMLLVLFTNIPEFDPVILILMVIGGILGGIIGRKIAKKLTSDATDKLFTIVLFLIIIICIVNIARFSMI